jgi:zinc/manganese transport system permease protein
MLDYDFMQNAFAAATIVSVVSGLVGYFLVLRGQTFAGHALAHVGFTGATGAVLVGVAPLWGLVAMTVAAGVSMGVLGERLVQRDVAIGIILAFSLGLGLLFLH